jgi:hypothetical protein
MDVKPIKTFETKPWLLNRHYAKRLPSISYAFGLFDKGSLVGVCTYGSPASPSLCVGVCGEEYRDKVVELNRLVIDSSEPNGASILVSRSLKLLPKPSIVVSYADTAQGHVGYVYQSTNFLYTGATAERTDMGGEEGKHSRHAKDPSIRVFRSSKHRYITFTGSKSQKRFLKNKLNYSIEAYPKGESSKYDASGYVEKQGVLF